MNKKYKERVELHCRTNQSAGYGVSKIEAILSFVRENNMPAVAFTDYGSIECYPKIQKEMKNHYPDIKPIYGLDLLVADDLLSASAVNAKIMFDDMPVNYVSILVKNEQGLKNLYRLFTMASMNKKNKAPCLKLSLLLEQREGLLLGTSGCTGELFCSIFRSCDKTVVKEIASRFDFLEVQPVENYVHKYENKNSDIPCTRDTIRVVHDEIIALGLELGIPVVATSDSHYLRPEDKCSWQVLLNAHGRENEMADELFFRTTEEMLNAFSYLGREKAYEIVVHNTNLIANEIQKIFPVVNAKHIVEIEDADNKLRKLCDKAIARKWSPIPECYSEQLEQELSDIEKHGFATIYLHYYDLIHNNHLHPSQYYLLGKATSSLVLFVLGVSQTDPLNPELPLYVEYFSGYYGNKEPLIELRIAKSDENKVMTAIDRLPGVGCKIRMVHRFLTTTYKADKWIKDYEQKFGNFVSFLEREKIEKDLTNCRDDRVQLNRTRIMIVPKRTKVMDYFPLDLDDTGKEIVGHYYYMDIDHLFRIYDIFGTYRGELLKNMYEKTNYYPSDVDIKTDKFFKQIQKFEDYDFASKYVLDYVIDIIKTAKPNSIAEYLKLHVLFENRYLWEAYGEEFLNKNYRFDKLVATVEDIFEKLLSQGIDRENAFKLSEKFRKELLGQEHETIMRQIGLDKWMISFLLRKVHLESRASFVERVKCDLRILYYNVNYPDIFSQVCSELSGKTTYHAHEW